MFLAYKYNEFEIRKHQYTDSYFTIYKDDHVYSSIACRTAKVAKKVIDRAFPENRHAELIPMFHENSVNNKTLTLVSCVCGCGETFFKNTNQRKKFVFGHNTKEYYKKLKNPWNKK